MMKLRNVKEQNEFWKQNVLCQMQKKFTNGEVWFSTFLRCSSHLTPKHSMKVWWWFHTPHSKCPDPLHKDDVQQCGWAIHTTCRRKMSQKVENTETQVDEKKSAFPLKKEYRKQKELHWYVWQGMVLKNSHMGHFPDRVDPLVVQNVSKFLMICFQGMRQENYSNIKQHSENKNQVFTANNQLVWFGQYIHKGKI